MHTRSTILAGSAAAIFGGRWSPVAEAPKEFSSADFQKHVSDLKDVTDKVKGYAEKANTEIKNLGKLTEETKAAADENLMKMNELSTRVTEMEQKASMHRGGGDAEEHKSIGQRFVESDDVKNAMASGMKWKGRVSVEVKNITSASASGASSTTALVPADRQPGLIMQPVRQLVVRDLLMPGRTNSSSIEYVKENVVTLNAAPVAENPSAPKPQSDITYLQTNTPVRTLAHFIMASKQIMDDAPQLQSQIDYRLRYGLGFVEDQQLLAGDGTGMNLLGLIPQATGYAKPIWRHGAEPDADRHAPTRHAAGHPRALSGDRPRAAPRPTGRTSS